jgi:tetratricopeptide (TPR) repeat protein
MRIRTIQRSRLWRFSQTKKSAFVLYGRHSVSFLRRPLTYLPCRKYSESLKGLIGPSPTDNDPYFESLKKGLEAQNKGDFASALQIFNELIAKYPDDARGWLQRGHLYFATHKYQDALNDFQQVLRYVPQHLPAYTALGACYEQLGDYDKALTHYDHVLYFEPQNVPVLLMRGALYWKRKQFLDAVRDFEKASREQPNNETALKELASAYIQTGKLSEALTTFDRLLQINPKNSFALTGKGIIYYLMEKYAEATIQFTAVLQNEPDNTDVLVKRASCYLNVANIEKAFTDSQRALQIDVSPYRHFSLTFFSFPSVAFLQQIHILHSDLDVICDCVFVRLFV